VEKCGRDNKWQHYVHFRRITYFLANNGDVLIKPSALGDLLNSSKKVTIDTNGGNLVILSNADGQSQGGVYVANADLKTSGGNLTIAGSRSSVTSNNFNTYISSSTGGWISPDVGGKSAPGPVGTLGFATGNNSGWFLNNAHSANNLAVYFHSNVTISTSGSSSAGNFFVYTNGKNDAGASKTNALWSEISNGSIVSKDASLSAGVSNIYDSSYTQASTNLYITQATLVAVQLFTFCLLQL